MEQRFAAVVHIRMTHQFAAILCFVIGEKTRIVGLPDKTLCPFDMFRRLSIIGKAHDLKTRIGTVQQNTVFQKGI